MSELASIQQLWAVWRTMSFPRPLAGKEIDGCDLVLLDSSAAGCISTFLDSGNVDSLDARRLELLGNCMHSLSRICPQLPEEHQVYFEMLKEISGRVVVCCRRDLR